MICSALGIIAIGARVKIAIGKIVLVTLDARLLTALTKEPNKALVALRVPERRPGRFVAFEVAESEAWWYLPVKAAASGLRPPTRRIIEPTVLRPRRA